MKQLSMSNNQLSIIQSGSNNQFISHFRFTVRQLLSFAHCLLITVHCSLFTANAQEIFTASAFYDNIRLYHPLVRQSALFQEEVRAEIMQARGAFDPKLFSSFDRKEFGRDLYYNKWRAGVSVPLKLAGADVKVTYDDNQGLYINPEDNVPNTGLLAVGLSVPLGQGLLTDARRTALRQAEAATTLAEADRLKLINKTLFDAAKTYWDWFLAYRQFTLIDEGYRLADTRFRAVRQRATLGDAAMIDTTEALITAQDRLVQRQQAEVDLQNARLAVSTFLWADGAAPLDLPAMVAPESPVNGILPESVVQALLDSAAKRHPELLKLDGKAQQLALDERFWRQMVRPQLSVNAMFLSKTDTPGVGYDLSSYYAFRPENHKIGIDFVLPVFLRKERGKLRQIQVKQQQVVFDRQQTSRDILNDVRAAYNSLLTLADQLTVQSQTVQNQEVLLRAEQQKFDLGESSLFLVNTRETKLIDLRIKREELRAKYQKAIAQLYFTAGTTR